MKFATPYKRNKFLFSPSGSSIEKIYRLKINFIDGSYELIEIGEKNIQDEIQSHFESVSLPHLISRFENGDVEALNSRQGEYLDATSIPKTVYEVHEQIADLEKWFKCTELSKKMSFDKFVKEYDFEFGINQQNGKVQIEKDENKKQEVEEEKGEK